MLGRLNRWIAPVACTLVLAGCGSIGAIGLPFGRDRAPARPPDLTLAAPTEPVESAELPPPGTDPDSDFNGGPSADIADAGGGDLLSDPGEASGEPQPQTSVAAANAVEVGRTDLLGGWTITTAGESCQLFMTLTAWTGGYRASTKGCNSLALASISAWKLDGRQVVLSSGEGTPVARLYGSGNNRFDGQIDAGGAPVSFFR